MRRKWICFMIVTVLAAGLCLTACKKDDKNTDATVQEQTDEREEMEVNPNEVIMTVGEEAVSCDEAKIYLYLLKQQYEAGIGEEIWDFDMGDGVDFKTYAKEQIINELIEIKIIVQQGKVLDIALEEEEIQEAKELAGDLISQATTEDKATFALTEAGVEAVYKDHLLATKVYNIATNEVDTNVSEEEARQISIQYIQIMTKGTDKNGNTVTLDAEQKVAARQRVQEVYNDIDAETDFASYAEANTDAKETELTFSKSDMPEDFGEEAFALKTGEMSRIIEGEEGFYIIYCASDNDEDATTARKEEIIEERQNEVFERKFQEWTTEYEVIKSTDIWDSVTF